MKKYLTILVLLVCSLILAGCGEKEVTTTSISIDESSIPDYILIQQFAEQIANIKFNVNKSDNTSEVKNVTKDMIGSEDLLKINSLGKQKITITYETFTAELTLNIKNYEVKVVYEDGSVAGKGVQVQWCDSKVCYTPVLTSDNGQAAINLDEGEYYIHIENIPEGYTYDPNAYVTNSQNYSLEIKLLKLSNYVQGEGTSENPYVVECGTYSSTYQGLGKNNALYFSFTAAEEGTYNITSISMDALATKKVDPYIGFLNPGNSDISSADVSGNVKDDINFNYSFEAQKGVTYTFILFVSEVETTASEKFPASFEFIISKIA